MLKGQGSGNTAGWPRLCLWATVVATTMSGCAPQGTRYGAWNISDPTDAFKLHPRDCPSEMTVAQCEQIKTSPPTSAWIGATPPQPEQQTKVQAEFQAGVNARAAKCTTGDKQMCLRYAEQKEVELRAFCEGQYISAAIQISEYKSMGWPAEMTAEHISMSADLLIPLVRAGYSGKWKSGQDFNDEARRRCLNGDLF